MRPCLYTLQPIHLPTAESSFSPMPTCFPFRSLKYDSRVSTKFSVTTAYHGVNTGDLGIRRADQTRSKQFGFSLGFICGYRWAYAGFTKQTRRTTRIDSDVAWGRRMKPLDTVDACMGQPTGDTVENINGEFDSHLRMSFVVLVTSSPPSMSNQTLLSFSVLVSRRCVWPYAPQSQA